MVSVKFKRRHGGVSLCDARSTLRHTFDSPVDVDVMWCSTALINLFRTSMERIRSRDQQPY